MQIPETVLIEIGQILLPVIKELRTEPGASTAKQVVKVIQFNKRMYEL